MKINNCRCGRKAKVERNPTIFEHRFYVDCTRYHCWQGPHRKSEREAIKAWNKVMEKKL